MMYAGLKKMIVCLLWVVCLPFINTAFAHQSSTAYLSITTHPAQAVQARYRIALRDLAILVDLDANNDQRITWGEIKQQQQPIARLLTQDFHWQSTDQQACQVNPVQQPFALEEIAGAVYLVAYISIDCAPQAASHLDYQILAGIDRGHRVLVSVLDSQSQSDSGTPSQRTWLAGNGLITLDAAKNSAWQRMSSYLLEGVHHLITGYDHLLFLFCLLLPAVYSRQNKQWVAVTSPYIAIKNTLWIATAFTVAHSITLCLAALKVVVLPAQWIESIIAFSIALAALNNLFPVIVRKQLYFAFAFGLVHGFGFANVLSDLPLDSLSRALSLLAFNVGIELGQIICILIFLPIALLLRQGQFYRQVVFNAGSVAACILALLWMTQRIFDLQWIAG